MQNYRNSLRSESKQVALNYIIDSLWVRTRHVSDYLIVGSTNSYSFKCSKLLCIMMIWEINTQAEHSPILSTKFWKHSFNGIPDKFRIPTLSSQPVNPVSVSVYAHALRIHTRRGKSGKNITTCTEHVLAYRSRVPANRRWGNRHHNTSGVSVCVCVPPPPLPPPPDARRPQTIVRRMHKILFSGIMCAVLCLLHPPQPVCDNLFRNHRHKIRLFIAGVLVVIIIKRRSHAHTHAHYTQKSLPTRNTTHGEKNKIPHVCVCCGTIRAWFRACVLCDVCLTSVRRGGSQRATPNESNDAVHELAHRSCLISTPIWSWFIVVRIRAHKSDGVWNSH